MNYIAPAFAANASLALFQGIQNLTGSGTRRQGGRAGKKQGNGAAGGQQATSLSSTFRQATRTTPHLPPPPPDNSYSVRGFRFALRYHAQGAREYREAPCLASISPAWRT